MAKPLTAYDRKRLARRDEHWPDAKGRIYNRKEEAGFCTVPRTLVMIATLIRHLSKNDASRVYLDLWMRQRDDGFVEAEDPLEMAASAALSGTRAQKSWREKIDVLAKLGFLEVRGKGTQRYRFILLHHPHDVVQKIRHETPKKIPDEWWSYFEHRVQDIGATLRWKPEKKPKGKATDFLDDDDLPF